MNESHPEGSICLLNWRKGIILSAGLLAWFSVVRILWNDWRIDPQYSYGFLVPLLIVGLLSRRWDDRPTPMPPSRSASLFCATVVVVSGILLALLIPLSEGNPDWRPLGLVAAMAAVVATLGVLFLTGGTAWMRHFAFPVVFFLIAVPWPRNFEQSVMTALMSWNTGTTLEILHWCGYEAQRQGNLIMIPGGILGIEEACSGIRSLQSGLMVALFFGEVFRVKIPKRVALLIVALIAALLGNIVRSSLLALVASSQGLAAVAQWHDPAGLLVLVVTVAAILIFAFLWRGKNGFNSVLTIQGQVGGFMHVSAAAKVSFLVFLLILASLAGTEYWFRSNEGARNSVADWELRPRGHISGVMSVRVDPATLRMLYYPEGFSERWASINGEMGQVFYFRWPAGRTSVQAVSMHNPEVCLSSIGMHLQKPLSPIVCETSMLRLPFQAWLFEQHGRPVYVFHAIIKDGDVSKEAPEKFDDSPMARMENVFKGRRNPGERMIEVAFWNLPDEAVAREALRQYISHALVLKHASEGAEEINR